MSISSLHTLAAVGVGAAKLGGIIETQMPIQTSNRSEVVSGNVYPTFLSVAGKKITASFASRDIALALATVPLAGIDLATKNLDLYAQGRLDGGARGGTNRKYTAAKGVLVLGELSAAHQDDARVSMDATIVSGSAQADPIVVGEAATLLAGIVDNVFYTIGKVTVGGYLVTQISDINISFGVSVLAEGSDSDIWDSHASITSISPTITITGNMIEWLKAANIPLGGKALALADTIIYLRKRIQGGMFVANATAAHVKIAATGIAQVGSALDASGATPHASRLTLSTRMEGANLPLVINTASAIT